MTSNNNVTSQGPVVTLLDSCGSDLSVVNAARVSFAKESAWDIVDNGNFGQIKKLPSNDARLLRYLAKHGHWTPFAHPQVTFRVTCCIAVARQLHKHQVGFVVNEVSRRYVSTTPTFYVPDTLRAATPDKKQGSGGVSGNSGDGRCMIEHLYEDALNVYEALLAGGICEEQARLVLPLGVNTEFVWTGSLAGWLRVIGLRCAEDAQQETRDVADMISTHIKRMFPQSYAAYYHRE